MGPLHSAKQGMEGWRTGVIVRADLMRTWMWSHSKARSGLTGLEIEAHQATVRRHILTFFLTTTDFLVCLVLHTAQPAPQGPQPIWVSPAAANVAAPTPTA